MNDVKTFLSRMRTFDPEKQYYAFTFLADDNGIKWSAMSHWIGYTSGQPRREIRQASLVIPSKMAALWNAIGYRYVVADSTEALSIFLRVGGHALIEENIAREWLTEMTEPFTVVADGPVGFRSINGLPHDQLRHAPSPKLRMKILSRDQRKCRYCGRSPDLNTDIELHLHHIKPWGRGGITDERNLITLCHTCHKGLDPHEDPTLYAILDPSREHLNLDQRRSDFHEGVRLYRARVRSKWGL